MHELRNVGWGKMDSILCSLDDEIHPKSCIRFFREVNLSAVQERRAQYVQQSKAKPSYTAFVTKAVAQALREHPYANRRLFWGFPKKRLIEFCGVHISIAVERDTKAANPETIYDADRLTLEELGTALASTASKQAADAERWAQFEKLVRHLPRFATLIVVSYLPRMFPRLWMKWRGGATLITSPAKYGVDMISGFWHWPLTFSFGYVKPRAIIVDGRLEIHPSTVLGLVWDRRVMVGAPAARFFNRVAELLEQPEQLLGVPGEPTRRA